MLVYNSANIVLLGSPIIVGDVVTSSISFTSKVSGHDAGDTLQIKVYRDEALAQQIKSNEITMEGVGEGDYIDLSITLRVIDNVNS